MATDWIQALQAMSQGLERLAPQILELLGKDDLTQAQAQKVWDDVGAMCDEIAETIEKMHDDEADEAIIEFADQLEDAVLTLHELVGGRLVDLGGLRGPLRPDEMM